MAKQTKPVVFHTLDVGSGESEHILRLARKYPRKLFGAIDPLYKKKRRELYKGETAAREKMKEAGVRVFQRRVDTLFEIMTKRGWKVKNINVDMPYRVSSSTEDNISWYTFFDQLSNVLLPNGKVVVTTELKENAQYLVDVAPRFGYKIRRLPHLSKLEKERKSPYTKDFSWALIYHLEIRRDPKKKQGLAPSPPRPPPHVPKEGERKWVYWSDGRTEREVFHGGKWKKAPPRPFIVQIQRKLSAWRRLRRRTRK